MWAGIYGTSCPQCGPRCRYGGDFLVVKLKSFDYEDMDNYHGLSILELSKFRHGEMILKGVLEHFEKVHTHGIYRGRRKIIWYIHIIESRHLVEYDIDVSIKVDDIYMASPQSTVKYVQETREETYQKFTLLILKQVQTLQVIFWSISVRHVSMSRDVTVTYNNFLNITLSIFLVLYMY